MKIYPFNDDYEKKSLEYEVSCCGNAIEVYSCDVSAVPFNQVWPGYQRPENQTEKSAFVIIGSDECVVLDIEAKRKFKKVTVRPLTRKIQPEVQDGRVKISFPGEGQYVVEFDDAHHVLNVFINPSKNFQDNSLEENVLYYGPGVHYEKERVQLESGQTVLIDEGAVVYGAFEAIDKKDIKIIGYGIIDNSYMNRANEINGCSILAPDRGDDTGNPIFLDRCQNITIEGVTLVNSSGWNVYIDGCSDVTVDNIKIVGQWRYNADGVDFCNCKNAVIRNSFLRTFDDCIVVKGFKLNNNLPCENIFAENCVLWCDWGRPLEVGAETSAPYMKNIRFRNCDIINGCHVMLDIQHGDKAEITDVYFEDIHIEYRMSTECPMLQSSRDEVYINSDDTHMPVLFEIIAGTTMWSIDKTSGKLNNVYFKNIEVITEDGQIPLDSKIAVREGENKIESVFFENITVNGIKQDSESLRVNIDSTISNVIWK